MKKTYLTVVLLFIAIVTNAQTNKDFNEFRRGILDDYSSFRKGVLENYAKYLEGVWKDFQTFRGEKRDDTPKPVAIPKADNTPVMIDPQELPQPQDVPELRPENPSEPAPVAPAPPKPQAPAPSVPTPPTPPSTRMQGFTFCGISMKAAQIPSFRLEGLNPGQVASTWRSYQNCGYKEALNSLNMLSDAYGLNDWFRMELVKSYSNAVLKGFGASDRILLQHFILSNMGYDIRLAKSGNHLVLLVPSKQKIYERQFVQLDGVNYYIFEDDSVSGSEAGISTCQLPENEYRGEMMNMLFVRPLKTESGDSRERVLSDGHITLRGTVNTGMMEMLRHYPIMDIPEYAKSNILPPFHKSLVEQARPYVENMSKVEAAQALLSFVQHSFDYATDGQQHGYEKPYFIEENFYYPKNDCEDRAIFYAFLVRNVLGLDVHLIHFPGHECTAVSFDGSDVGGYGYTYNGKRFVICDPTYIGASIGNCMKQYRQTKPEVELW